MRVLRVLLAGLLALAVAAPAVAYAQQKPPVRVGGSVKEPKKIKSVAPVYPQEAKEAGIQGVVILETLIEKDGTVGDIKVLRSVPLLEAAAVDAVKQWVYEPTLMDGEPVQVLMVVTVNFTLK
jgi:protein TonB